MLKVLVISLLCLLTLYAPIELSRMIMKYGLELALVFELSLIWVFYLAAIVILTKVVRV